MKNNKGITLLVLTITIIVLLIITSITIHNVSGQIEIKKVNNLYSDIESISTKVSAYYLQYNDLPIFEDENATPYITSQNLMNLLKLNGATSPELNPNDDDNYYVINLSQLDNLTLNYGEDFIKWKENPSLTYTTSDAVYIINKVTHQIYFPHGVKRGDTIYYTRDLAVEVVDPITNDNDLIDFQVTINGADISKYTKSILNDETTNRISLEIAIDNVDEINSLQYGWIISTENEDAADLTGFSLTEGKATLVSKPLEEGNYKLVIKIMDKEGNQYIKSSGEVNIVHNSLQQTNNAIDGNVLEQN